METRVRWRSAEAAKDVVIRPVPDNAAQSLRLCGASTQHLQRVPASYWFRFRLAVETSRTICLVLAEQPVAKSCSTLIVETASREAHFTPRLFRELVCRVELRKPYAAASSELRAAWQQTG